MTWEEDPEEKWINNFFLEEDPEEERLNDFFYNTTVDEGVGRPVAFSSLGIKHWACGCNNPIASSSNKFKPLLETRSARPFACPQDVNPRWFLKVQRKVASRRWRRSGKYNGQTFDDFESQARSRFSALEDRWFW